MLKSSGFQYQRYEPSIIPMGIVYVLQPLYNS